MEFRPWNCTLDLRSVCCFIALCEHGSFTAAARACGVRQPCVTKSVTRLERTLRTRLFERRRPLRQTPLAADLLPLMKDLRSAAERVCAFVNDRAETFSTIGNPPLHLEVNASSAPSPSTEFTDSWP